MHQQTHLPQLPFKSPPSPPTSAPPRSPLAPSARVLTRVLAGAADIETDPEDRFRDQGPFRPVLHAEVQNPGYPGTNFQGGIQRHY